MPTKIYRYNFRRTLTANASWPDITAFEANNSSICTKPILRNDVATANSLPTPDGLKSYRLNGTIASGSDASLTEAGHPTNADSEMLGGYCILPSSFEHYTNPGQYDIRIATGASDSAVATASKLAIFEGTHASTRPRWPGDLKGWVPSRSMINGAQSVISSDGSIWTINHSGTGIGGTNEPLGDGPTFTDNANKVWNRVYRDDDKTILLTALYYMQAPHNSRTAVGQVGTTITDYGSQVSVTTWGANKIRVNMTGRFGNCLTFYPVITTYLRTIEIQEVAPTLEDVNIYDQLGENKDQAPDLYCHEKTGLPVAKISAINGASNFTLTGTHAAYYDIITRTGGNIWIRSIAPIPDSMAGPLNLSVVQTDPNATPQTSHTTVLTGNLISSGGKPLVGKHSRRQARGWVQRKKVMDVYDARWPGAIGAADVVLTVNSTATLKAAIDGLNPASNNTTKWEIQLQNGVYTGTANPSASKDFVNGWLRLVPAPGHDPEVSCGISWNCRNLHIKGLRLTTNFQKRAGGGVYQFLTGTNTPINGIAGRYSRWIFEDCRVGAGFDDDVTLEEFLYHTNDTDRYWQFFYGHKFDSLEIKNCTFIGQRGCIAPHAARLVVVEHCDTQWSRNDFIQMRGRLDLDQWSGGFGGDEDMNVVVRFNTSRNETDLAGYVNTAHTDFMQVTRQISDQEWEPNGLCPAANTKIVNNYVQPVRVYQLGSVGTVRDALGNVVTPAYYGPSMPTGTVLNGTETNGDVTLTYLGTIMPMNLNCVVEENTVNADGPLRGVAARQFIIDSNIGRGQPTNLVSFNNCVASPPNIGITIGSGTVVSDQNIMFGQAHLTSLNKADLDPDTNDASDPTDQPQSPVITVADGKLYSSGDIVAQYGAIGTGGGTAGVQGKKFEDDTVLICRPIPATNPNLVLNGPFVQKTEGLNLGWWHYPQIDDSGTNSKEEFDRQMRTALVSLDGVSGIYNRFEVELDAGATLTLTKEQLEDATLIHNGADTATDEGPIQVRWQTGAGDTGALDGADISIDIE